MINRYVGNLPPMPGVFPDYLAPVIRDFEGGREMVMMRWGMPPPPRTGGPPVTNIRNTTSPHWRIWLRPEHRCIVPANSFAEYAPEPNPETKKKDVVWFALNEDRPLFLTGLSRTGLLFFPTASDLDLRGKYHGEQVITSVKSDVSGGFRITESLGRHGGWLPWNHKQSYSLKIVDPMIIEITEGKTVTRFFKCSAKTPSL